MTVPEAVADVFMTAFRALPHTQQNAVLAKMVRDQELREDLVDLAIAEARHHEKARLFLPFFNKLKKKRNIR